MTTKLPPPTWKWRWRWSPLWWYWGRADILNGGVRIQHRGFGPLFLYRTWVETPVSMRGARRC